MEQEDIYGHYVCVSEECEGEGAINPHLPTL
jgi:hypothetical protein